MPKIPRPLSLAEYVASKQATIIHCSLEPGVQPLSSAIPAILEQHPERVDVLIGPVGDFSPEETALLAEAGAVSVSLGKTVLRSETAALYALSIVRYEILKAS